MPMNNTHESNNNDASLQRGYILPEGVEGGGENVVRMNGDLEEGTHGQLFICHQDDETHPVQHRERKRSVHNSMEKKRKEKIRFFINKIGEVLPPVDNPEKEKIGRSTLDIVEKAYEYIQELQVTTSRLLEENPDEVAALKSALLSVTQERNQYAEQLRHAGLSASICAQGFADPSFEAPTPQIGLGGGETDPMTPPLTTETGDNKSKNAKKKRNTISLQLEIKKQHQQHQMELSAPGMVGNYGMMMHSNAMMVGGNQMMMQPQHMMGTVGHGRGQGDNSEPNDTEMAGAGLLQLAMQDAGITPNTSQCASSDENVVSVPTQAVGDCVTGVNENSALETLASIATVPQTVGVVGSSAPVSQAAVSPLVSQSGSAMTATTQAINANMPIMATGQSGMGQIGPNNGMMNVPFVNGGQQFPPGLLQGQQAGFNAGISAPQQQIVFINEQGMPCIANVPMGIDPNTLGLPNFQKHVMGVDKTGNIGMQGFGNMMVQKDQGMSSELLTNMNLQGQQAFQQAQNAVAMGTAGMVQQQMSLGQQVMPPMHQLAGGIGNQGQQGLIMPVSQSGNLLINPSNQNQGPPGSQLPQALLLPNGQIIPVVANPQAGGGGGGIIQAGVNGGGGVIQTNAQWQGGSIQPSGAPQGAIPASGGQPRMSMPPGMQGSMVGVDGMMGTSAGAMSSSTAQMQVGQPQVAYSQQSSNLGLLMTTASNLPGTTAVANSSVSQPLSETSHTGSSVDSVATATSKSATSATLGGMGQQSMVTTVDMKQTSQGEAGMMRFPDTDMTDQNGGPQVMMRSTGSAGAFPSMSDSMTMPPTSGPPGNGGMPMMPAPPSGGVGGGGNGTILLTMNLNGQPTSVLVDPTTMQVLGTVQNPQQSVAQPPPSQQIGGQAAQVGGQPVQVAGQQVAGQQVTGPPVQVTPPGTTTSKKSKKNSQRVICPKPSARNKSGRTMEAELFGNEDNEQSETPPVKKSKSKKKASKATAAAPTTVESTPLEEVAMDTTDILAKAAESIFSSDISPPIGGFYNPANEDNPLQIDTSAGDTEEDPEGGGSPRKDPGHHSNRAPPDAVIGNSQVKELHMSGEGSDILGTGPTLSQQEVSDMLDNNMMMGSRDDILSDVASISLHNDVKKVAMDKAPVDKGEGDTAVFSAPPSGDPPKKSSKKSKKAEKDKLCGQEKSKAEDDLENAVKEIINTVKNNTPPPPVKKTSKKSKKQLAMEKTASVSTTPPTVQTTVSATKPVEPIDTEPVMAFPDTIIFSEKELSDVLDQVENLGSSLSDSSQTVTPPKRSKSKKNKSDTSSSSEPATKKQRKGSAQDKIKPTTIADSSVNKSSMSVYDFDEEVPEELSSPLRSLQTKRNSSSSVNYASVSTNVQPTKSASSSLMGRGHVSSVRMSDNLPFSSHASANNDGRLLPVQHQLQLMSSSQDSSAGFMEDPMSQRPLFDTQPLPPPKEKKSKKRSKSKKSSKSQPATTVVSDLPESESLTESQKTTQVPEKTVPSIQPSTSLDPFEKTSSFEEFESNSKKKDEEIEKMDIDLLEKSPVHSTPKKDLSVDFDLRTSRGNGGLLTCVTDSVIVNHSLTSSAQRSDPSPQVTLRDTVSLTDPVHISTNSLASSENSDIDNTMNSILGLTAATLSPHIISPGQQQTQMTHHMRVRSPQLQTPMSTSPVSMASPQQQSLQHSVLMSVASSDPIVSRASSVTSCSSMTNFSPGDLPYSAESLFNPASEKTSVASASKPTSLAISRSDSDKSSHGLYDKSQMGSKARNGIYSVDNFVQTNKGEDLRTEKPTNQVNVISSPLTSSLNRIGNENSSDGFNFASIGLNLATPTTSSTSIMDSLNMSPIISSIANTSVTSSSFTFTLSSVTSTSTTSSASMSAHDNQQGGHPYPFYSPQSHQMSSSSTVSSNMQNVSNLMSSASQQQQDQQQQQPLSMSNFDLDLGSGVTSHLVHQQKRPSNETVAPPHNQSSQSEMFYGMSGGNPPPSCSIPNQQQREPQEQPPMIPNITVSSHNPISKSQSEQIHNAHKRMQDLGQGPVHGVPPSGKSANPDHRGGDLGSLDRQYSMKNSNPDPRSNDLASMDRQYSIKSSNPDPRSNDLNSMDRQFNMKSSNTDPRGNDLSAMDRQFNMKSSNTDPRGNDLSTMDRQYNMKSSNVDPRGTDLSSMDRQFNMKSSNTDPRGTDLSSMDRQFNMKSSNTDPRGTDLSSMDRQFNMKSSNTDPRGNDLSSMERQQFSMNNVQPFFPPPNFSNASSQSMNTHPLRHPPLNTIEERSGVSGARAYEPIFSPHSQGFNPTSQSFGGSRYDSSVMFPHQRESSGVVGVSQPLSHTPPIQSDGRKSANSQSSSAKSNKQTGNQQPQHSVGQQQQQPRALSGPPPHTVPTPPHHAPSHRPTPPQAGTQPPPTHQSQVSHSRQQKSSTSRSKQSQKKNKQQQQPMYSEMESAFPHPMFEANRSLTPFFGIPPQNLSPPARNMQNEAPGLFPANLFGAGPRHTATASMPKNAEISAPYNPLFPPGRPQNGLGLNFQPGFGMNSVHGAMSNASSITPHSGSVTVTPHMSNFSFTNIFSDVNNSSQNDSLNISPIKFPHSNPMVPHQGMDPNSLQHPHHQGGSIYHPHNRSHPPPPVLHNAMSINSILGQHHHGFETRGVPQGMNTSAPPFHGAGHPSFMPPLNFSVHDH